MLENTNGKLVPFSSTDMAKMSIPLNQNYEIPNFEQGEEAPILSEAPEKRSAYSKSFRTKDGGMIATVYRDPVHFKKNGNWVEYDNTLRPGTHEALGDVYENTTSDVQIRFAKKAKNKQLVCLESDGFTLSWGLQGTQQNPGLSRMAANQEICFMVKPRKMKTKALKKVVLPKKKAAIEEHNREKSAVHTSFSKGFYPDILPGINLEYQIMANRLKENIIIKDRQAAKTPLSFEMRHKGLTPIVQEDGTIEFIQSGHPERVVFVFPVPYMTDASDSASDNVHYQLVTQNDQKSILSILPDKEWMEADARVFPIVIDPQTETQKTQNDIDDTFVASKMPNAGYLSSYGSFNVGRNYDEGMCRALIKFKQLPVLDPGDIIYKARLQVWQYEFSAIGAQSFKIVANEPNGAWSPETSWNTQPGYINETLDFQEVSQVRDGNVINVTPKVFDITRLVRKWYNTGVNNGIMLRGAEESSRDAVARFFTSNFDFGAAGIPGGEAQYPTGFFIYRNATGLENYWSFHKQELGRAGTGYVNDFNGNLVFVHKDAHTNGSRMPVEIKHVYNLTDSNKSSRFGYGWMISAMQRLDGNGSNENPYYYTDEDGTHHYFYDDNGVKRDEDGLGLEYSGIDEGELQHKITAKNKTVMKFDVWGYLRRTIDANGNTISYNYGPNSNGNFLGNVHDGADRVISFYYNSDMSRLDKIVDPAGRETLYSYDGNGNLIKITYADGTDTRFEYSGHRLTKVVTSNGYSMEYSYILDMQVPRISKVLEKKGNENGQGFKVSYFNGNTTYFTVPTATGDGNIETTSGNMRYTYQFDNAGRPISVRDPEGNANSYKYYSESVKNNKLNTTGRVQATVQNFVMNPSFEYVDDPWHFYALKGGLNFGVNRIDNFGCMDKRSIKVTKNTMESMAGVAQDLSLPVRNYPYVLSAYVKAENIVANASAGVPAGAVLMVVKVNADGTHRILATSEAVAGTTDTAIDDGWVRIQVPFTLITGDTSDVKIMGGLNEATGDAWFDCFQVEIGAVANKFNLINDPGFEISSDNSRALKYWGGGSTTTSDGRVAYGNDPDVTNPNNKDGKYCLGIFGEFGKRKSFSQAINVCGEQGDIFHLSCSCASRPVPGKELSIAAAVIYESGDPKWTTFNFNEYMTEWQYVGGIVSTDDGIAGSTRKYKAIHVYIFLSDQNNYGWFEGVQLTKDNGRSYTYNSSGELVTVQSNAEAMQFSSDGNDNMTRLTSPGGDHFEYTYNGKNQLQVAKNMQGVQTSFEYDAFGNPIDARVEHCRVSRAVVPGRTYFIRQKTSGKYLDVSGGVDENGRNVWQYSFNGSISQKWKILEAKNGYVMLQPELCPTRVLDINNGSSDDGANAQVWDKNNSNAQLYKLKVISDGSYQILAKCADDKKCLTNQGGHTDAGTNIDLRGIVGEHPDQSWYFEPADDGKTRSDTPKSRKTYFIRSRLTGQYWDVSGNGKTENTPIVQYFLHQGENQRFSLEAVNNEPGYFYISPESFLPMNLGINSENKLALVNPANSDRQKFSFTKKSNGYYTIKVKDANGGKNTLGIAGGSFSAMANIDVWTDDNVTSQEFILDELSEFIWTHMNFTEDGSQVRDVLTKTNSHLDYAYDAQGLLQKVEERDDFSTQKKATNYEYYPVTDLLKKTKTKVDNTTYTEVSFEYEVDKVKKITRNGFSYELDFDNYGNIEQIHVAGQPYLTNFYKPHNGTLYKTVFANGDFVENTIDKYGRVLSQTNVIGRPVFEATYDGSGNLTKEKDAVTNREIIYHYDLAGRMVGMDTKGNGSSDHYQRTLFDEMNRASVVKQKIGNQMVTTEYIFGTKNNPEDIPEVIKAIKVNGENAVSYEFDELMRPKKRTYHTTTPVIATYSMKAGKRLGATTDLVQRLTLGNKQIDYTYDDFGNILSITEDNALKTTYTYDLRGQLVQEENHNLGKRVGYTYDLHGNILSRTFTDLENSSMVNTVSYQYDTIWKDKLSHYNGQVITYDANGNPLTYRDGMNFEWAKGRELMSMTKNNVRTDYYYDSKGIRMEKKTGNASTYFYLNGKTIVGQICGTDRFDFLYDESKNLIGFLYNGQKYFYLQNKQNDIVAIVDNSGSPVVNYTYDSWGKTITISGSMKDTLGVKNPFRYRGYYYDAESGLYYLLSRYYDPETGRFINPDVIMGVNDKDPMSYNLYVYCNNDPINRCDTSGHFWGIISDWFKYAVIGAYVAVRVIAESFYNFTRNPTPKWNPSGGGNNTPTRPTPSWGGDSYDDSGIWTDAAFAIGDAGFVSYIPEYSVLKSPVSSVGLLGPLMLGISIGGNMQKYEGNDLLIANTIDCVAFGAGVGAGIFIGTFAAGAFIGTVGLPAVAVIAFTVTAWTVIGYTAREIKKLLDN